MYDARFGLGIIVIDIYWHICSTLTQSKHSKYKIQCCSPLSKIQNKVFTSSLKYKLHCCSPPLQNTKSKNIIHLSSRAQVLCSFCFSGSLQSRLCYICTGTVIFMYLNIVFSYFVTSVYFNVCLSGCLQSRLNRCRQVSSKLSLWKTLSCFGGQQFSTDTANFQIELSIGLLLLLNLSISPIEGLIYT